MSYPYNVDPASNRLNGVAGPTPTSYSHDAAGNLLSSSATGSFTHDARLRLVRATSGSTATDYRLNALGQRVAKLATSGGTHYHYDAAGRLVAESDASGKVQKEYVWLGATPVAMIESTAPPAESTCPATPQLRPPGGFTPFEWRERMEVHSGRPGKRGWEWGLGTNTRDFEASAREDLNWVSGKPYGFRLTYDGVGNAHVRVTDAGTELFTLTWAGDMDVGNALRFVVRSQEGIGAGNLIRVDITNIDGQAVSESLATAGDNTLSREVRIFSGESLKDGYTVEGTVTFVFTGAYPPLGNRLDFHVTAGNVACAGAASGAGEAQIRIYYIHPDHLDTPRVLTDEQNRVVWRWDADPFGAYPADEDPDGDGTKVALNLRFPGQYFDRETNLHYNYFRDYDPSTGRYAQSDPIGLAGGINPYAYVDGDPLFFVDPLGLVQAPGTLESFIPVWGSAKHALHDFECGRWGWGLFNTGMAALDVFGGATLLKAGWRLGSHTWKRTRPWLTQTGFAEKGKHVHHAFVPQKWISSETEWLFNQPWNLKPLTPPPGIDPGRWHMMVEGRTPGLYAPQRWWHGTPAWAKAAETSMVGKAANAATNCGCQ